MPLNCTLKMVKIGKYYVMYIYHNEKKERGKKLG